MHHLGKGGEWVFRGVHRPSEGLSQSVTWGASWPFVPPLHPYLRVYSTPSAVELETEVPTLPSDGSA